MPLTETQRGVARGIVAGATITVAALALAVLMLPESVLPADDVANRLSFALKWDALLALCLLLSIGRLARHRFFTPDDIDGGGLSSGTSQAHVLQATLQNTLEQVALGVVTHLIWAVTMPQAWQAAIPAAATLFVVGRILFIRGYDGGAPARALGFALTFYPTVVMLLIAVARIATGLRG